MPRTPPGLPVADPDRTLSVEEAFERICEIEVRHDLLQFMIDGWCVWPLLRFEVARLLTFAPSGTHAYPSNSRRLVIGLRDVPRLIARRRARYVVKTFVSGLLESTNGGFKDIWFDDLLSETGAYFKIDAINNLAFLPRRQRALLKSHLTTASFEITASILTRAARSAAVNEIAKRLSACLVAELGLGSLTPRALAIRLGHFHWLKQLYAALLARVGPRYLLTADPGEHAFVAAAKERGVTAVEFQHGINDQHHPGYAWGAYALPYKRRMPVPDRLFLYGEHWRRELDRGGFWGDTLRVVGSLRLDQYRGQVNHRLAPRCTVLFTTQGTDVQSVIAFFAEFLSAAGDLDFQMYIKLHPIFDSSKASYARAFQGDPRVQVLLAHEGASTFELLSRSHLHLSISSASHYDALGLGVPTVILPFSGHEIVMSLHRAGHALLARTPLELLDIVTRWREYRVAPEVGEYYFKSGALENMKQELGAA